MVTQMYDTRCTIFVTFQQEGEHCYPSAPEGVEFLRYPHRHMFHFTVEMEVFHDDREVEFILFKRELESLYNHDGIFTADSQSCEMLARSLYAYISNKYGQERYLKVVVSEDGENGATIEGIPRK